MAPPPIPAASKAKTIAHMNADHAGDLALYLRHLAQLPAAAARGAVLVDLDLASVTLRTAAGRAHVLPLHPPMRSWEDRRPRLVALSAEAHAALDPVPWAPPRRPGELFVLAGVVLYLACLGALRAGLADEGTPLSAGLARSNFPGGPEGFRWIVDALAWPVIGIHAAECAWIHWSRLAPRGMGWGSLTWWSWMANCFLEGYPLWLRFDATVEARVQGVKEREAKGR